MMRKNGNLLLNDLIDNYSSFQSDVVLQSLPRDYFNWGRDPRHQMDNTELLPSLPKAKNKMKRAAKAGVSWLQRAISPEKYYFNEIQKYATFEASYLLMSDNYSRSLFSQLLTMQVLKEKSYRLATFTDVHVSAYERASATVLESEDILPVYQWELRRVLDERHGIELFTGPELLCLSYLDRVYRYSCDANVIEIERGDVVLDCGVGWGDTTVMFASRVGPDGEVHSFELNDDGLSVLERQISTSGVSAKIRPNKMAVSDIDDVTIYVGEASPATRITDLVRNGSPVDTITIDTYCSRNGIRTVDFIKMDIEGAEAMALRGARNLISEQKPKLAISVYHKWDDLREIPMLISSIRPDYEFFLDCTTGFGGETVLYCR